jgi:hypothetical protein
MARAVAIPVAVAADACWLWGCDDAWQLPQPVHCGPQLVAHMVVLWQLQGLWGLW